MWLNIYFLIGICYMIANCYLHDDYTKETLKYYFKKKNLKWCYSTPKDLLVLVAVIFWVVLWPLGTIYVLCEDIKYWLKHKD